MRSELSISGKAVGVAVSHTGRKVSVEASWPNAYFCLQSSAGSGPGFQMIFSIGCSSHTMANTYSPLLQGFGWCGPSSSSSAAVVFAITAAPSTASRPSSGSMRSTWSLTGRPITTQPCPFISVCTSPCFAWRPWGAQQQRVSRLGWREGAAVGLSKRLWELCCLTVACSEEMVLDAFEPPWVWSWTTPPTAPSHPRLRV